MRAPLGEMRELEVRDSGGAVQAPSKHSTRIGLANTGAPRGERDLLLRDGRS